MASKLPLHEWIIVGLILTIMMFITLITAYKSSSVPKVIEHVQQQALDEIEVKVEGAVEKPDFYIVPKGSVMEAVLEKARPTEEADLSPLKLKSELRDGQKIKVLKKEMITIVIEGAVKYPGPLVIEKGKKLEDLLGIVELTPEANDKVLKRKRKLQDQEVVKVPTKSESKKPAKEKKDTIKKRESKKVKAVRNSAVEPQ